LPLRIDTYIGRHKGGLNLPFIKIEDKCAEEKNDLKVIDDPENIGSVQVIVVT
jgi:hypothetical protein